MYVEFSSSSYQQLIEQLAQNLRASQFGNPFQKEWIVVQNKETQQWITLQLASELGIAANLEFVLPSELIWKLYRQLDPEIPTRLPGDRNPMQWRIFELLKSDSAVLKQSGLNIPESDESRIMLADQIADVFDLYQIYRPGMLKEWESGKKTSFHPSENWQSAMWKSLKARWKRQVGFTSDRAEAFEELVSRLESGEIYLSNLPERVSIIGLSQWSEPFARLLSRLASRMEVQHYILQYEVDGDSERSRVIKDWITPKSNSIALLDSINGPIKREEDLTTGNPSIRIHSTHNPRREVEVLKYELLSLLQNNPSCGLNDILIMVPDLEEYGHLLKSVFEYDEGEPGLPIIIPRTSSNNEALVLSKLFDLLGEEIKVNAFMDFLELGLISESVGINQQESLRLRNWLAKTNTHWGLNENSSSYSIVKSLDELFMGFSFDSYALDTLHEVVPYSGISASDDVELIARFSSFVQKIHKISAGTATSKTVPEWLNVLRGWLKLLLPNQTNSFMIIENLTDQLRFVEDQSAISFSVFSSWCLEQFTTQSAASTSLGYGIVVSTYIPYRNLPFKVKAMLGFDEGTFPRKVIRPPFDLIHLEPKPGDRITGEDDKLLFLETLFSTSEHLHLSYVGENEKSPKMVSMLVQQLLDVDETIPKIKHHKLHKFDSEYVSSANNFSGWNRELVVELTKKKSSNPFENGVGEPEVKAIIQVQDLIIFWKHPSRYILENQLGIFTSFEEQELEDREVFKLGGLTRYGLNQEIERALIEGIGREELFVYLTRKGTLSDTVSARNQFEQEFQTTNDFLSEVKEYINEKPNEIEVNLDVDGLEIQGKIGNNFNNQLVLWRNGKARAVDFTEFWIKHLLLQSTSNFDTSIFISKSTKNEIILHRLAEVNNPKMIIKEFVRIYRERRAMVPFFPESSMAFVDAELNRKKGLDSALKHWMGNNYISGEGENYFNHLLWRGKDPILTQEFKDVANTFWEPFLKHLNQGGNG